MATIHRRTFLERLGLGAGAGLLSPTLGALVNHAQGQTNKRKRLLLVCQGNGMNFNHFAPPGHKPADADARVGKGKLYTADNITLPPMFAPLGAYKDRVLLVDGLSSFIGEKNHSLGYSALSCLPGVPDSLAGPGGPSFDQAMAATALGRNVPFPSLLLGPFGSNDRPLMTTVFAKGRQQKAPHFAHVSAAYKETFSNLARPDTGGGPAPYDRRKKLLDFVRDDVKRAQGALAGLEKAKFDQFLASVEALDKRMAEFARATEAARQNSKLTPITSEPGGLETRASLHMQVAATALASNLTNVVGFSAAAGNSYPVWRGLGLNRDAHAHGHGEREGKPITPLEMVYVFFAEQIVKAMKLLEAVPEGDGTMLDNTIIVWLSDQAEQHHPFLWRWPAVVIASPRRSGLRTGGRFLRFPLAQRPGDASALRKFPTKDLVARAKAPGGRCLADLFCSVAHALGAPTDTFGAGGHEVVQGPIPELMA